MSEIIIDCTVLPECPNGWSILSQEEQMRSRFQGRLLWDPNMVDLYQSYEQSIGGWVEPIELQNEIDKKDLRVLPSNLIDSIILTPDLFPLEWKYKIIACWGTIFVCPKGELCIRCISWDRVDYVEFSSGFNSRFNAIYVV